jgi:tRNA uridine 5-carbamoylmethylation protein Kti12
VEKLKTIIVMIGAPGSGKTTFIKNNLLNSGKKYVIISTDDLIEAEADRIGKTYSEVWKTFFKRAEKQAGRTFKEAIKNGDDIIYDQTNWSSLKRKGLLQSVGKDYYKIAVYFTIPLDVLQDRVKKRGDATGKKIPPNVVESMYNKLDEPHTEEGFDEIVLIGEETQEV